MPPFDQKQQNSLNALLYDAVIGGNLERTKLCLSRGAQAGKADMTEYFSERNTNPAPLAQLAYRYYNREVLDVLAQSGLIVDEKDDEGYTALATAASEQNAVCVKHFLAIGANPMAELGDGKTVLDVARQNSGYSGAAVRDSIIDMLLTAVPVADDFNASAKKSDGPVSTAEAITVNKPISLTPHKKSGFEL